MLTLLKVFVENILPIMLIIAMGFTLERKFTLDLATLTRIAFYGVVPVFLFVSIYTAEIPQEMYLIFIFSVSYLLLSYGLSFISRLFPFYSRAERGVLANASMFFNCANMGLPVLILVYRGTSFYEQAIAIQISVILIQAVTLQTVGIYVAKSSRGDIHWKEALKATLRMPTLIAVILGMIFKQLPADLTAGFFWPSLEYLHQMLIGLVLTTFGIQLGKSSWSIDIRKTAFPVILRLVIGPAAAYLLILLFGFEGATAQVLLISFSMPSAVNIALIAAEVGTAPRLASQIVLGSTFGSIFVLSLVIYLASLLFPV